MSIHHIIVSASCLDYEEFRFLKVQWSVDNFFSSFCFGGGGGGGGFKSIHPNPHLLVSSNYDIHYQIFDGQRIVVKKKKRKLRKI